jgi:hypothetical protein
MVDIVGTETNKNERSCHAHEVCGAQLVPGSKVRIRRETYISPTTGDEEDCLVAYVVGNGVMTCKVGYLPRHLAIRRADDYNGCMLAWSRFIHLDHSTLRSVRSTTATLDAVWQRSLGMRPSVLYNIITMYDMIRL